MTTKSNLPERRPRPDLELVDVAWCDRPIPQFMVDLPWAGSDEEAMEEILGRILDAQSVADVLSRSPVEKFEDMLGRKITVHGFRLRPSDVEGGWGAYAVIDFTAIGKTAHVVTTTSAQSVLTALSTIYQLGGFPFDCSVQEVPMNRTGKNNPLYLAGVGEEPF